MASVTLSTSLSLRPHLPERRSHRPHPPFLSPASLAAPNDASASLCHLHPPCVTRLSKNLKSRDPTSTLGFGEMAWTTDVRFVGHTEAAGSSEAVRNKGVPSRAVPSAAGHPMAPCLDASLLQAFLRSQAPSSLVPLARTFFSYHSVSHSSLSLSPRLSEPRLKGPLLFSTRSSGYHAGLSMEDEPQDPVDTKCTCPFLRQHSPGVHPPSQ